MPFTSTRTFGIELEVVNSVRDTYRVLRAAGINVHMENYNHSARPHWKVVTDGSVAGGAEVVSPVLRGEEGIADARRVAEALAAADIRVDRRCGFHVHIGADDLSADDLRSLVKRYAAFEADIDAFMPASRRGSTNEYCRSMAPHADRIDHLPGSAIDVARGLGDRYRKLNVQSLWRQGTVEFRQHSGTVDADKIDNWVRFCAAFVDASRGATHAAPANPYQPRADYRRQARRNWAEIIEQVEAAGGTMEPSAPRARSYRITGPGGETVVTQADMLGCYVSSTSYDLQPVRFAQFWINRVAPVLAAPAVEGAERAEDSLFAGMASEVADFFRARSAALSRPRRATTA